MRSTADDQVGLADAGRRPSLVPGPGEELLYDHKRELATSADSSRVLRYCPDILTILRRLPGAHGCGLRVRSS